jgi:hypothetical protein
MTNLKTLDALLERVAQWPEEAQAELVQSVIDIETRRLGLYHLSDEERAAPARSEEDVRAGRFATDEEVAAAFYEVAEDQVVIRNVRHGARRRPWE